MTRFAELGLIEPLLRSLEREGYREPTPIQARGIGPVLRGRDLLGIAQTGTGKTAAFALPILQRITETPAQPVRPIQALVLAPTRELATQIGRSFEIYGRHLDIRSYSLYGGVPEGPQITALQRGVDVVVATPGRLIDLHRKGHVALDGVRMVVLDEADLMLDMGFVPDIRKILATLPKQRQNLLFSATMPAGVAGLAAQILRDPVRVEIAPSATPVTQIRQQVMHLERLNKPRLLAHLLTTLPFERALVFVRTRHGADRLVELLARASVQASAMHGDLSQNARTQALEAFRDGSAPVLIATDVAARGIDVAQVSHVFNYELPSEPETYVHRIGRTGRAGAEGLAIAFCDETEGGLLRDIERLTGAPLTPIFTHPWHTHDAVPPLNATGPAKGGRRVSKSRRKR